MRVKVFDDRVSMASGSIEEDINEWLSQNSKVRITHVCAVSAGEPSEMMERPYARCYVFYIEE